MLALVVVLAGCGSAPQEPQGRLTEAQIRQLEAITTLGYVVGTHPAPAVTGVTINEPEAYPGYTLFTSRDRPGALLIDMQGNVIKSWYAPLGFYWSRVALQPDGSLVVITGGPPSILKIGADNVVQWHRGGLYHHDLQVMEDGRIYVLFRKWVERPGLHALPIAEDFIAELDPQGNEVRRVSLLNAFTDSPLYRNYLDVLAVPPDEWTETDEGCDIFHTNSLQVFEMKGGLHALVSIRNISTVAIVNMETGLVVWAQAGMWRKQHEARWTQDGIMLFDNVGHEGRSKILEFNPMTQEVLWQYDDPLFFSKGCGSQQILPNGNVLITESFYGRIFEVTRKGRIVWEYYNTFKTDEGKIVRILRAQRFGESVLAVR